MRTRKKDVGREMAGEAVVPAARVEEVGLALVSDTRQEGSSEQIARRAHEDLPRARRRRRGRAR